MGRERRQNYTPTACKHTGACQCKFGLRENAYFWLSLILVFDPNPFRRHLIWRTTWGLLALGYIRPNPSWVWQRNCTFSHHICKSLASFGTFVLPIVPGFWRLYSLPFYPLCTMVGWLLPLRRDCLLEMAASTTREAWECISIPRVAQLMARCQYNFNSGRTGRYLQLRSFTFLHCRISESLFSLDNGN